MLKAKGYSNNAFFPDPQLIFISHMGSIWCNDYDNNDDDDADDISTINGRSILTKMN